MSHVTTALRVLQAVGGRSDPTAPISVGDMTRDLDVSLSTASRLCAELTAHRLLERAAAYGSYRIGPAAVRLSGAAAAPFAHAVRFALTLVAQQTGETVLLAVRAERGLRVIAAVESIWTLHSPADVSEAIVDPRSAALRAADASDIQAENLRLYESILGDSVEVATPVLGPAGDAVAVVAVRFPLHRIEAATPRARRAVVTAARRIEHELEQWLLTRAGGPAAERGPLSRRATVRQPTADLDEVVAPERMSALAGALRVLSHLAGAQDTVAGIARATGLRPDRVHRLVDACRRAGYVVDGADEMHLQLSWRLHGWYRAAVVPTIVGQARDLVAATAVRTSTCGFVTMLKGIRSFTIVEELELASEGLRMVPWLGRAHPIVGSDGGPTMLMDFDADEVTQLFPTRHSERERKVFLERMTKVRRDGLLAMEAFEDGGMLSISAPIRDASGTVCAAACLVATMECASERIEEISAETARLAADVSAVLQHGAEDARPAPSGRIPHPAGGTLEGSPIPSPSSRA